MDMSELFRRHLAALHKAPLAKTVQNRKEDLLKERKMKRETLANAKRNIQVNMSPYNTPLANQIYQKSHGSEAKRSNTEGNTKRLEMLAKWKAEKAKQKQTEAANKKPIFKVCHVSPKASTDLENINKLIKGKAMLTSAIKKSQFAPDNHKFRPPNGVKPINLNFSSTGSKVWQNNEKSRTANVKFSTTPVCSKPELSRTKRPVHDTPQQSMKPFRATSGLNEKKVLKAEPNSQIKKTVTATHSRCDGATLKTSENTKKIATHTTPKPLVSSAAVKTRQNLTKKTPLTHHTPKLTAGASNITGRQGSVNKNVKSNFTPQVLTVSRNRVSPKRQARTETKNSMNSNVISKQGSTNTKGKTFSRKIRTPPKSTDESKNEYIHSLDKKIPDEVASLTPKTSDISANSKQSETAEHSEDLKNNNRRSLKVSASRKKSFPGKSKGLIIENELEVSKGAPSIRLKRKMQKEVNKSLSIGDSSSRTDIDGIDDKSGSGDTSQEQKTPVYNSPFVTIARGKRNAAMEYKIRRSAGEDSLTPAQKSGADYFLAKLESEIERINKICQIWENCLQESELPEEAHSFIDVAIGQSKLLIAKKFEQFRGLIIQCKTKQYDEKVITCEDLHGFWDMVFMQVEDLDKRFANLEKMKENNWVEILPEKKAAPPKKTKTRPKKVKTTSRLKDMIKAAREMQKAAEKGVVVEDGKVLNEECYDIKSPLREPTLPEPRTRSAKKDLRVSILKSVENKKRCSSSPGLTMMKISQSIKQGNGLTPAKSILKIDRSKSTGKKSVVFKDLSESPKKLRKTVLFIGQQENTQRNSTSEGEDEKENATPVAVRRSTRLRVH